ncbi:MAG: hypothetical protein K6A36_02980 [Paludibacteraceae bacterium]|nr:hypothetical protein [Paludibacteraceae bacterium]
MRKIVHFICFVTLMACLSGCHSFSADSKRLQRQVTERESYAEQQLEHLTAALVHHAPMDTIRAIAEQDAELLFYVFDATRLLYWSDNWLSSGEVLVPGYDKWRYGHFRNAHALVRWTRVDEYNIMTVIPIRYDYPLETRLMRNSFVEPFDISAKRGITRYRRDDYAPIYSSDGDYLFSLTPEAEPLDNTEGYAMASQSFSFRTLLEADESLDTPWWKPDGLHGRVYFRLCLGLFALLMIIGIWVLIRNRGIRNMRLSTRIMYVILICVLSVFIYMFLMSVRYVRTNFEERQREQLLTRSEYIQSYLRSLYYWDMTLTTSQSRGLSSDLHDLGHDLNQDIHVYMLSGELLATSSTTLFQNGVLSLRMAPEALFCDNHSVICYEHLATHPYLVAYVPFYNGSFVPIGYIAMPYFLSEQTRWREVDQLLARMLPPYIIILLLALIFSYAAARSMSSPIMLLTDKMRHFEIGAKDNHVTYPYHDEIGLLVERYNLLVDRVEKSAEQLAKAEREGAWQTMARQIAHEINNPLTPMKLSVQKLQRMHGTEQFDAYFDKATRMLVMEIDNLSHIAQSFSTFAKQPEVITSEVDIAQKLSDVITLQRSNDQNIPIRYVGPDSGIMVYADREQIGQVFVNILRNALQALEGRPDADIIVMLNALYSDREIQISFSDNGPGIPEDVQPRIFRPSFTTKSNGNGLGLAISKRIIEGTGGRITFDSNDKGTTFYVYLQKPNA